jgi:amino acid transporter
MPAAFAKLSGFFILCGVIASVAVRHWWPLLLFGVLILLCLMVANKIEANNPR